MDDIIVVEIVNRFKHLLDCLRGVLFRKFSVLADAVKKLSTSRKLGHDVIFVLIPKSSALSAIGCGSNTLDSNQSWNRTICGCFIRCNKTISSYTIFSFPRTFFFNIILTAYLSPAHSASRTIPYVPAPNVLPNLYWALPRCVSAMFRSDKRVK